MRLVANAAGELAAALALAASLSNKLKDDNLRAVTFAATAEMLEITSNIGDFMLAMKVPAEIEKPGLTVMNAAQVAGVVEGMDKAAVVEITTDTTLATIVSGRSTYRLPVIAPGCMPPPLQVAEETGTTTLAREEAVALFARPAFAMSTDINRFYLNGLLVHDAGRDLIGVATDGHRLARVTIAGAAGLSSDRSLIVPLRAVEAINRLLRHKNAERITLRRSSRGLFELSTTSATFISRLIDGTFPDYHCVIPAPSGNTVVVERTALFAALARVAAAAAPRAKVPPRAGLTWSADEPLLHLSLAGWDTADDAIVAEVTGTGRVALNAWQMTELLNAVTGKRCRLDSSGGNVSVTVTDPSDAMFLAVQTPSVWPVEQAA
jgi:DNA polymerase-3 subunit beta